MGMFITSTRAAISSWNLWSTSVLIYPGPCLPHLMCHASTPCKKNQKHVVYHEIQSISLQHPSVREDYRPLDDHLYEFQIKELNILSVEMMSVIEFLGTLCPSAKGIGVNHWFILQLVNTCVPNKCQHWYPESVYLVAILGKILKLSTASAAATKLSFLRGWEWNKT